MASSKMLKDFLRDDPPPSPRDTSMFSSFEAVIAKAFKAVLPRTRRATKVPRREEEAKATVVKIKDIVRWTSFGDLVEDVHSGPPTSGTGSTSWSCTTSSSGSGGNGSSWGESDFSEEFSPSPAWWETTKTFLAKETKMVSTFCDDKEQPESPVSVVGFRFGEDEDAYVEDRSQEANVEDTAKLMLNHVTEIANNSMILKGELHRSSEWGIGGRKDAYVKEMDESGRWTGFEEGEKMGIVLEVEAYLFDDVLMKEILVECLAH